MSDNVKSAVCAVGVDRCRNILIFFFRCISAIYDSVSFTMLAVLCMYNFSNQYAASSVLLCYTVLFDGLLCVIFS